MTRYGMLSLDWSDVHENGKVTMGGAGWYRIGQVGAAMKANGYDAHVGNNLLQYPSGELVLSMPDNSVVDGCDVMVIQRWMDRNAPESIRKARACGQVVIQDVDDWWEGIATSNRAWLQTHPKMNPNTNREHYKKAIAASDGITVSTPFLYVKYAKMMSHMPRFLVRNALDVEKFKPQDQLTDMIVGWVGTATHRSGDLEILRGVLAPWLRTHPSVGFYHGGGESPKTDARNILGIDDTKTRCKSMPMQIISNYPKFFTRFNTGIVPLSTAPFNSAKSPLKGMEYSAAGIPFVASATPEYRWLHETHGVGIIADRPKQWLQALDQLLDPDFRAIRGDEARIAIQALDISRQWHRWVEAYEAIASSVPARVAV